MLKVETICQIPAAQQGIGNVNYWTGCGESQEGLVVVVEQSRFTYLFKIKYAVINPIQHVQDVT